MAGSDKVRRFLVCRAGSTLGAIPVEHVGETLPPLPVTQLADVPPYVLGVAILRGNATPIVDLNRLLTPATAQSAGAPRRFVSVHVGPRTLGLAVEEVIGVRALPEAVLAEVPPLVHAIDSAYLSSMGALDAGIVLLLEASRLLPESTWATLAAAGAAA